jgi:hypothetical protein
MGFDRGGCKMSRTSDNTAVVPGTTRGNHDGGMATLLADARKWKKPAQCTEDSPGPRIPAYLCPRYSVPGTPTTGRTPADIPKKSVLDNAFVGGGGQPTTGDANLIILPGRTLGEDMDQSPQLLNDRGRKSDVVHGDPGYTAHERTPV